MTALVVEEVIGNKYIVSDQSVSNEGALVLRDYNRKDRLEPIGDGFHDDFIYDIAQADWAEVRHRIWIRLLRDKHDIGVTKGKGKGGPNRVPVVVVEERV